MSTNYYVEAAKAALKTGKSIEEVSKNLEEISDKARLRGAWPVWRAVNEAIVVLDI